MAVAYELLRDIPKEERDAFVELYKNSDIRRRILAVVERRYQDYDRPAPESYNTNYPYIVAQYDGYRTACEEIMRLLDVR